MGIGVLSAIPFVTEQPQQVLKAAFEQGYGSVPTYSAYYESLGYAAGNYTNPLQQLNSNGQVTLIIAIGGIVAERSAAWSPAQKDTVSLVGGKVPNAPNPGTGKFKDRISLESFNNDVHRRNWLQQHYAINPNRICLLFNPNSIMGPGHEVPGFAHSEPANIDQNTSPAQATTEFTRAFNHIAQMGPPAIQAVIISADPWFKQRSAQLVPVANNWASGGAGGKRVMYPLQEYLSDYGGIKPAYVTLYGPSLVDAYHRLGQLAATGVSPGDPPQHIT